MVTWNEIEGSWNQIKGRIQERWSDLTDDELGTARGNVNQIVGTIQKKTGETREAVEKFIEELAANGQSIAGKAAQTASQYAEQATEAARRGYQQASQKVAAGVEHAQDTVRRRPVESLAVAFGAGMIVGVVTAIMMRSR
jgi:uncharacterized protein YjbJ (UPF0337 family)